MTCNKINLEPFSEQLLKILANAGNLPIFNLDPELQIVSHNTAAREKLAAGAELCGKSLSEFLSDESRLELNTHLNRQYFFLRIGFKFGFDLIQSVDAHFCQHAQGWLLVGEHIIVSAGEILDQITQLNNEMANISRDLLQKNRMLQRARDQIKTLSNLLPVCSYCKKIRNDSGYWKTMESYISEAAKAQFSHGICPDCLLKNFPEFAEEVLE